MNSVTRDSRITHTANRHPTEIAQAGDGVHAIHARASAAGRDCSGPSYDTIRCVVGPNHASRSAPNAAKSAPSDWVSEPATPFKPAIPLTIASAVGTSAARKNAHAAVTATKVRTGPNDERATSASRRTPRRLRFHT